jgi:hypothetical protein
MRIIREHKEEDPGRICHITQGQNSRIVAPQEDALIGIDEDFLAWLYIAPGYEESERGRGLLDLARQWLGPDAWAVVMMAQVHTEQDQNILEAMGLEVIESYENAAPASAGISVHLARTL